MLLFLCLPDSRESAGLPSPDESYQLHRTLDEAASCDGRGRLVVLDGTRAELDEGAAGLRVRGVAPETMLNLGADWYLPPEAVAAAGGYVLRGSPAGLEVLLIHRRGAWDLPKGKLDPGESPEAGAVREVAEEVGVPERSLEVICPLGITTHGYPHPKRPTYAVKTTHWYAMRTSANRFVPQAAEDIEAVEWVSWSEAGARLDFETLRVHHATIDLDSIGF